MQAGVLVRLEHHTQIRCAVDELLVVGDVPELAFGVVVSFEIPIGRGRDDEMDRLVRNIGHLARVAERARAMLAKGASRRDVIDQIAQLRVQVTRYRHMPAARVYELGSRIMG